MIAMRQRRSRRLSTAGTLQPSAQSLFKRAFNATMASGGGSDRGIVLDSPTSVIAHGQPSSSKETTPGTHLIT